MPHSQEIQLEIQKLERRVSEINRKISEDKSLGALGENLRKQRQWAKNKIEELQKEFIKKQAAEALETKEYEHKRNDLFISRIQRLVDLMEKKHDYMKEIKEELEKIRKHLEYTLK